MRQYARKLPMFASQLQILNDGRVHRFVTDDGAMPLRYSQVLDLWQHDEPFRTFFISRLTDVPFSAYRWETPAISKSTVNRAFEFVVLDSPGLDRTPDRLSFAEHFTSDETDPGIAVFPNLGKDAWMVVPSPRASDAAYGHLAAFTRHAPQSQQHALWQTVGREVQQRLSDRPLWLSTAGAGVTWLHVRLDSRPKYYGFRPFKNPNADLGPTLP
jgi:hypothetical protein